MKLSSEWFYMPLVAVSFSSCFGAAIDIGPGYRCVDESQVVTDIHAINHLGFSAQMVLDNIVGSHEAPLYWKSVSDGIALTLGPESGPSSLTMDLAYSGAPIHMVVSRLEVEDDFRADIADTECPDRIEIPVNAHIRSAQGALNESVQATVSASMAQLASLHHEFTLDSIMGSLHVAHKSPDNLRISNLQLSAGISTFGMAGEIHAETIFRTGSGKDGAVGMGHPSVASFPREVRYCSNHDIEAPFEGRLQQFSGADVMQKITEIQPFAFAWQHHSHTSLMNVEMGTLDNFVPSETVVCFTPEITDRGAPFLGARFRAPLHISSDDASVDATFWTEVLVEGMPDGTMGSIRFELEHSRSQGLSVAEFLNLYKITGVDLSAYQHAALEFEGRLSPRQNQGQGTLTVLGEIRHECSDKPGDACAGVDHIEVAQAVWNSNLP